jgi:hypothetical protein
MNRIIFNNKATIAFVLVAVLILVGNGLAYAQEDEHKEHEELCRTERNREMQLHLSTDSRLPGSDVTVTMSITLIESDRPRGWRDAGFIWVDSNGNTVSEWVIVDVVDGSGTRFADYGTWRVPTGETLTGYATATLTVPDVPPGTESTSMGMCRSSPWARGLPLV